MDFWLQAEKKSKPTLREVPDIPPDNLATRA
jgi:hypothetical protein